MYKQNHFAIQQKLTQHCKPTILQLKKQNTSIIAKTEFQSFFFLSANQHVLDQYNSYLV